MLNISKQAVMQLREYKARRGPDLYIRIGILSGNTTGPSLGIAVDERNDKDELFSFEDLEVIIDKGLLTYCQEIEVEYVQQEGAGCSSGGFRITAKNSI